MITATTPARQTPLNAITAADGARIWAEVQNEIPAGDDKQMHGSLALAGWWRGWFTQAQLDEFNARTQKLIRAARKARKSVQA